MKKKTDPLEGVNEITRVEIYRQMKLKMDADQAEIERVESVATNDRDEHETKIYKQFRLLCWLARGKGRAGEESKPAQAKTPKLSTARSARVKVEKDEETAIEAEVKPAKVVAATRKRRIATRNLDIPSPSAMDKEFMNGRNVLIDEEGIQNIGNLHITDDGPEVIMQRSNKRYNISWNEAWLAVYKTAVLDIRHDRTETFDEETEEPAEEVSDEVALEAVLNNYHQPDGDEG